MVTYYYYFNRREKTEGIRLLGGKKEGFNRIFLNNSKTKGGDNLWRTRNETREWNPFSPPPPLLSFANHSLDRCVRFRSGSRIFPVLLNPRRRRCAFTKVEPVGTIRRKKPKDRDARKESKRREERRGERREEEMRRERTSRSLMGYPPRTSCNVIVGDHSMDELSFVRISGGYLNAVRVHRLKRGSDEGNRRMEKIVRYGI